MLSVPEDLCTNGWSLRPCCMVVAYRIAYFCSARRKKNIISNLWVASALVPYRLIAECLFGYEIQAAASIGRRLTIRHGYGVVINKNVAAKDDFTLRHGVTVGNLGANDPSRPAIDNGVELGANVTLLGDTAIGDNVMIGVGSVVVDNVPDNTSAVGEETRVKVIK